MSKRTDGSADIIGINRNTGISTPPWLPDLYLKLTFSPRLREVVGRSAESIALVHRDAATLYQTRVGLARANLASQV